MWKKVLLGIAGFIILVVVLALVLTKSISDVVNKQLQALRQGDMITAYALTSKDFRNSTSLADFEKFVSNYPALKNNAKASWSSREINNGQGSLKGELIAIDGGVTPIEYRLVKENDEWKILGFSLKLSGATVSENAPKPAATNEPTAEEKIAKFREEGKDPKELAKGELHRIYMSDALNKDGNVDAPKLVIPKTAPKIYATVYIMHAKKGLKVAVQLVNTGTGGKIGPSVAVISQNGNVMRNFSFTNTDPIWPVGNYKINVITSNKQLGSVDFKVE